MFTFTIRGLIRLMVVAVLFMNIAIFTQIAFGWPRRAANCKWPIARGKTNSIAQSPPRPRNEWTNSLQMKFVRVKSLVQSSENPSRGLAERRSEVYVAATEVTVAQFSAFVKEAGYRTSAERDGTGGYGLNNRTGEVHGAPEFSWRHTGFSQGDDHPVVNISWIDAVAFCEWLGAKEKRRYRLPRQEEWEVLWRVSLNRVSRSGAAVNAFDGNIADNSLAAVLRTEKSSMNDGYAFTCPVEAFSPTVDGLFGIQGNVREWTGDAAGGNPNSQDSVSTELVGRTVLGSSWETDDATSKSVQAPREALRGFDRDCDIGFRVVVVTE